MKKIFILILLLPITICFSQNAELKSPNGKILIEIINNIELKYSISIDGQYLIRDAVIGLNIDGVEYPNENTTVLFSNISKINEVFNPIVPRKSSQVKDICNELSLNYSDQFEVVFRAYDNGVAYRIKTNLSNEIKIINEVVKINYEEDYNSYFPEEESFFSHYEREYKYVNLNSITSNQFCSLPVLVDCNNGIKIGVTESGLSDYPNLFLKGNSDNSLTGVFPKYVLETKSGKSADRDEIVTKEAKYIAKTQGERKLPWRIFMISESDKELIENQLVDILSDPNILKDSDWITPGKVAWDWWNALNIYGVDFDSGLNTETYKYYIDFASKYGLEYIILDEGWTKSTTNILASNDEIDVKELIDYGKKKNVGIILWVLWKPLNEDIEGILELYSNWGAKGVKVDFMQRADQWMVNYYEKVLQEAAKRRLLVDFHGAFKPAGFARKYPNYISNEGLKGLENVKWSEEITPDHDCTLPFTRMLAGAMDYTPGAMMNAQKENYSINFTKPMSMGTRAHQIALYTIFESPLQMLSDNPSNYLANKSSTEFISQIPTTWDETIAIDGAVGDYVILARRKNNNWYIGAITDWDEREFEIKLDFLNDSKYSISIASDGINANKYASDIKFEKSIVTKGDKIKIKMAKGGGYSAILKPNK